MHVKTRFAPSPTGSLHIGNVRTALYAWLFARQKNGTFLLRIEDSNVKSSKDDTVRNIITVMQWLNLDWDEGPYFQTDRFDRYNYIISYMIKNRIAYKCYCSADRLNSLRAAQIRKGEKPKYDGHCYVRNQSMGMQASYVVRFCNPKTGVVTFHDQIKGSITFNNQELDDLIIRRSDGTPTYNFCVIVDDMDMKITHVIRGEEHVNNTPRQINILKSLRATIPVYAHLPIILDCNRKKLSKSHGAAGIMQYRDDGFVPEALLNCLVRLGWSYGDQEIFTVEQMKKFFNINNISKSASIFDVKKLIWLNHYYINHLSVDNIASYLLWYMERQNINVQNGPKLSDVVSLFAKRVHTLKEIVDNCLYLYIDLDISQVPIAQYYLKPEQIKSLTILIKKLNNINNWTPESIKSAMTETVNELDSAFDVIGMPLRIALTGKNCSPELSAVMFLIGKVNVLNRINQAISYIYNTHGTFYRIQE